MFIEGINEDVFPPLDERVILSEYAHKLAQSADCIIVRENNRIEGLSAVYCNDYETKSSYLSLIAVSRALRNKGVAVKLLDETIQHSKLKGMERLVLETHKQNESALKLYLKYGFKELKNDENGVILMSYQIK